MSRVGCLGPWHAPGAHQLRTFRSATRQSLGSVVSLCTHLLEVREQALPAPTGIPECLPGIVVGSCTPGHDGTVENAAAANNMALSVVAGFVVEKLLTCRADVPVVRR